MEWWGVTWAGGSRFHREQVMVVCKGDPVWWELRLGSRVGPPHAMLSNREPLQ